ncbi:GNAT family N-acetyltransferase [Flavobacterium sp. F-65]|uniref:GNAT family N-acetyltransferase n=1 Tax=Flavobacterium pisciphilum TaxID=2893755 RepID=A0ABS8MS37_9FLAO|nr:GNAT family N-acetyltransferase [Flavobacterium sp. F-65]MCC9071571.1 GNAT family N-acetyltransferase [Flavobacterium sp. F-65]
MNPDYTKLDNPVWYSLSETHHEFAVDYNTIKFYHPDYCPFGGFTTQENITKSIDVYSELTDNFFIVGEKPQLSNQLELKKELICLQMIINNRLDIEIKENIVALTTSEHIDALFELVSLVQPGYFKRKTALLGNYFGIFKDNKLIAVTGERMKMNDFTEVSAIVTHPDYTGQGYAKQLIAHAVNTIFDQNKTPYLHVVESNISAIKLYEKLGFTTRRKMSLWHISK